ncbi:MAG TPA: hypothetical protein VHM92_10450 [Allosphingosinicella sp.]|nr:hypothetical protein [Allosphingosinicella sp.]
MRVNLAAIGAVEFRSDRLGPLDSIAHPLNPGIYHGDIWHGDTQVGSLTIQVAPGGSGDQVEIDLSEAVAGGHLQYRGHSDDENPLFVVFHSGGEASGFHVVLDADERDGAHFDSRALQPGDYFIVTPVRPGRWKMTYGDQDAGAGMLTVAQAVPAAKPRQSASGAMIRADGRSFAPSTAKIVSGDGVVFEVTGQDVAIRLSSADGRPVKKRQRTVGIRYLGRDEARAVARRPARGRKR